MKPFGEKCLNRLEIDLEKRICVPSKNFLKVARDLGKIEGELALGVMRYEIIAERRGSAGGETLLLRHEGIPDFVEIIGRLADNYGAPWDYLGTRDDVPPLFSYHVILDPDQRYGDKHDSDRTRAVRNIITYDKVELEVVKVENSKELEQKINLKNKEFAERFPVLPVRPLTYGGIKEHAAKATNLSIYLNKDLNKDPNKHAILEYVSLKNGRTGLTSIFRQLDLETPRRR